MNIEWNKVTWYSKLLAVVLFVSVFWLGFWFGVQTSEVGRDLVIKTVMYQ